VLTADVLMQKLTKVTKLHKKITDKKKPKEKKVKATESESSEE